MTLKKLKKELAAVSNVVFIVLIAILMVSASSVVILLVQGGKAQTSAGAGVKLGDVIKVDYIGALADGRVFDTSMYSVATDNARYPKALSFSLRSQSNYTPLQFTVGQGTLIRGFEQGVIGMTVGQTRVVTIPPALGYGVLNTSRLNYVSLTEGAPVFYTVNSSTFQSFFNVLPVVGLTVKDTVYGWNAQVLEVNKDADRVFIMNAPTVGQILPVYGDPTAAKPSGWYVQVISIDSTANGGLGLIKVRNLLTPADAGKVQGFTPTGSQFIVDQVDADPLNGQFRMNFNGELVGVTLYFTITIVSIG
ncbi:MAG TPA: FKBP-type peptidyl-prolyl cis-trans isomerase [Methanomassiliicoccales archaeon]|nr:FKBP-type peptidyl-prolyl cis-trans isomerase [Methanomassiliicoccales archaeon]